MRPATLQAFSEYVNINEAAELLGVNPATLRNWDKAGKLKPKRNPMNGYRMYRHADLMDLLSAEPQDAFAEGWAPKVDWTHIGKSEHFVRLYEDDAVLADSVSGFISVALEKGEGAIVIATNAHWHDIKTALQEQGIDIDAMQEDGQLLALDAAETLAKFMVGGAPDRERFNEVVGAQMAQMSKKYGHVHAFGEMVALLWNEGKREAAIHLETLWNELGKLHSFALFCAYPIGAFANVGDSEAFAKMCGCHSKIIPAESYASLVTPEQRLRAISQLQQNTAVLKAEIEYRKQIERSLLKREDEMKSNGDAKTLLAAVVESSEDAILTKNLDGIILSWNRAAERLFGYTASEAIGQKITMLIPPDRQHEEGLIIERLRRGERIEHYETVRITKDGTLIDISLAISPLRDASGSIIGASKIARNITEQKRLQNALRESERRKDEFLAMLAHELRNPLAPIKNALHVLEAPSATEEIKSEARKMMQRQVHQMKRLIDDLMDVSRINQGKIDLQRQRLTLNDVIQTAVEIAKPLIVDKRHVLAITQPPEPIWLNGDMVRLSQVFANLLNNAAKYTDEGGHITLTTYTKGNDAVVCLKDDGIGIPATMLPSIFDMFVQVDGSLERAQGGLGIGLTLVKKLVGLHGGSISVSSEGSGKGSEFTIRLPLASKKTEETAPAQPAEETNKAYRILVVDDNEASAKTLGWTLEIIGHEVKLAHRPETGLEIAKAYKPDVILLDIGLPGTNGYDLCKILRQQPEGKNATIIAQTGWGQAEHRARSKDAGFDHHLVKPIEMQALRQLLESLDTQTTN